MVKRGTENQQAFFMNQHTHLPLLRRWHVDGQICPPGGVIGPLQCSTVLRAGQHRHIPCLDPYLLLRAHTYKWVSQMPVCETVTWTDLSANEARCYNLNKMPLYYWAPKQKCGCFKTNVSWTSVSHFLKVNCTHMLMCAMVLSLNYPGPIFHQIISCVTNFAYKQSTNVQKYLKNLIYFYINTINHLNPAWTHSLIRAKALKSAVALTTSRFKMLFLF